jgi:DNA modification methylase
VPIFTAKEFNMPAKRIFKVDNFLALLHVSSLSTGDIARKLRCNRGTALKYLKELKARKQVIETRISNTLNLWKLTLFGNPILIGDCAQTLKQLPDESVDLIVTDPPYGYRFMNLDWDRALPSLEALKECCRVLKPGAFAYFMCSSRTDLIWRMGERLEKAGFVTAFSNIAWCFTTGLPKSANIAKLLNKRAENTSDTPEANKLEGSFGGHQLKPAMETILVVMRPLSEKTYIDQAMKNRHGISWLEDCRIPYASDSEKWKGGKNPTSASWRRLEGRTDIQMLNNIPNENGRFPANLLVSDDALNNGIINHGTNKPTARTAGAGALGQNKGWNSHNNKPTVHVTVNDSGSYSRFFDLDAWFRSKLPQEAQKTYPALIVPKPHKNEKNRYGENNHPTVKPLKLMSYLITMGSREGDLVLDPFAGSGTTLEAANMLKRRFIGCERDEKWKPLIEARAFRRTAVKSG